MTRVPRLKEDLLQRLGVSEDPVVRAAVRTSGEGRREREARLTASLRKKAERTKWSRQLYESADGGGLRGAHLTPNSSKWIEEGTLLLKGGDFVRGVKLRGNLMGTKTRSSRGRQPESVLCDFCSNRLESLGHIQQQCDRTHDARTFRHNRIMDYMLSRLDAAGYCTKKEQTIPTQAGQRRPDIIAWKPGIGSWVIDVQVVADAAAGDLHDAHWRKTSYYLNNPEVREYARDLSGFPPVFTTLTSSWRGILAAASVNSWVELGLSKADLNIVLARVIEGGNLIYATHRKTTGGRRNHPG